MLAYEFIMDIRLGIPLPHLHTDFDRFTEQDRSDILYKWEQIRGAIPQRIQFLEGVISIKQDLLSNEQHFATACLINSEIAELASIINDLHLYYRLNQEMERKHE